MAPALCDNYTTCKRTAEKGAKSRAARNPKQREIPDGAKSQTATECGTALVREVLATEGDRAGSIPALVAGHLFRPLRLPQFVAVWDFALFGIWRRLGFAM